MRGRSKRRQASDARPGQASAPVQQERVSLQLISDKLKRLTWRRRLWGVDQRQVWHVVERLDEMYRELYREQEIRYEALLERAQRGTPSESAPVPQRGRGAQAPGTPSVPDPRPDATSELSGARLATAYQPLQAIPASPVPSRYRGQTVSRPASVAQGVSAGLQPQAQPGTRQPSSSQTVQVPRARMASLAETRQGSHSATGPQAPQPKPPTPGSHRFRTS